MGNRLFSQNRSAHALSRHHSRDGAASDHNHLQVPQGNNNILRSPDLRESVSTPCAIDPSPEASRNLQDIFEDDLYGSGHKGHDRESKENSRRGLEAALNQTESRGELLSAPPPSHRAALFRTLSGSKLSVFTHQAGGHTYFLRLPSGKVCKPVIDRERLYYEAIQTASEDYRSFHAQYFGLVSIRPSTASNSSTNLAPGENSSSWTKFTTTSTASSSTTSVANSNSGSSSMQNMHEGVRFIHDDKWQKLAAACQGWEVGRMTHIVLEDLTARFHHPCVLDIKMGTRQHGLGDTPVKIARHQKKCAQTTSKQLGFRLCGLKVYRPSVKKYVNRDKYFGRQVTTKNLHEALLEFFDNGRANWRAVLALFIEKLRRILSYLENNGLPWRLYGTSLIFIYDGAGTEKRALHAPSWSADIRMVDFARAYTMDEVRALSKPGDDDDDGYLFGLRNLLGYLMQLAKLANATSLNTI